MALALKLAAAYLRNCYEGPSGISQYEQLIMRSLDDEESVPHAYPTTLVQAINLCWRRLAEQHDEAHQRAVFALQCAAFTESRQIPLQILLAAGVVDFDAILNFDTADGVLAYGLSNPPVGEIWRAMRS
ncbi:hypothetical protein AB0B25_24205 [Nocardia sp. NPDC049190]|uniref:hypothetical protein n=1 Tax=Nocardia sp. NPDC049190 TaxID=3155650 RepID=UPI0033F19B98